MTTPNHERALDCGSLGADGAHAAVNDTSNTVTSRDSSFLAGIRRGHLARGAAVLMLHPGAIVVMASHGRGRSAAIVGSVTEDMLQRTFGPIVLVGPKIEPNDFTGSVMVTVDGSEESEAALPLAAAWAIELGTTPWIINVSDPETTTGSAHADLLDTMYPARLAAGLRSQSEHGVEFDELHDRHPSKAVAEYAARHDAALIVASSHGRSGLSRLAMGSVAAGFVRHATCPVVVIRLPHPAHVDMRKRMWTYQPA